MKTGSEKTMEKTREIALIAAIISDNFCEKIHAMPNVGYFAAIEVITNAAFAFYENFEKELENKKTDWDDLCEKNGTDCYDQLITIWSKKYINKKHGYNL